AKISGKPLSLASALKKISSQNELKGVNNAGPATAQLFIVNPLNGGGVMKLFSTHPPVAERVRRLEELAAGRI
ncbi:MAG: M48 family metalloprotease, partial [Ignavibacteriaceae bacterium]|nr:M48 family metalloprotease [Ignavibacteriaceae bacterium]